MRKLLCWLNYHRWIIPAWDQQLRFCSSCQEWERKVAIPINGYTWAPMRSLEDFEDYAKSETR